MDEQGYTIKDKAFWHIMIALAATSLFIFATMYATQPILPQLTDDFNISVTYSSLAMSSTTVGLMIGLITIGFFSDLKGRTIFIKISILITALILLLIPFMESFAWIISLRLIQGFTMAGVLGAALAYISEEIDQRYVAFATTLYIATNSTGGMVGRFLTSYLTEVKSWQFAFWVLGIAGLMIFIYVLVALPKSQQFHPSLGTFREDAQGFLVHFKNPTLFIMFGLGIILQVSFTSMWTFLPFHLLQPPYTLTMGQISFFYFAYSFGIVGAPIAGWLVGKFSLRAIRIVGILFLSFGMLVVLFPSLLLLSIGLAIICLGFFITHSIAATTVSQTATHHKGSAASLYLVAYYIGVSAGTTFVAPLWEKSGWTGVILFAAILPVAYLGVVSLLSSKRGRKIAGK